MQLLMRGHYITQVAVALWDQKFTLAAPDCAHSSSALACLDQATALHSMQTLHGNHAMPHVLALLSLGERIAL